LPSITERGVSTSGLRRFALLRPSRSSFHCAQRLVIRITHLASWLTESQMEEYLGWVRGSRMPSIYVHMSGRDLDGDLLKMYGLEDKLDNEPVKLKMQECPHCRTVNTAGARICINCRKPLAVAEMMDRKEKVKEMLAAMVDIVAENPDMKAKFSKFFD
jgi:hypothetical protein